MMSIILLIIVGISCLGPSSVIANRKPSDYLGPMLAVNETPFLSIEFHSLANKILIEGEEQRKDIESVLRSVHSDLQEEKGMVLRGKLDHIIAMANEFADLGKNENGCGYNDLKYATIALNALYGDLYKFVDKETSSLGEHQRFERIAHYITRRLEDQLELCANTIAREYSRYGDAGPHSAEAELDTLIGNGDNNSDKLYSLTESKYKFIISDFKIDPSAINLGKSMKTNGYMKGNRAKSLSDICSRFSKDTNSFIEGLTFMKSFTPHFIAKISSRDTRLMKLNEYFRLCNRWILERP